MAPPTTQARLVPDEAAMLAFGGALAQAVLPLPPAGFLIDLRGDLGMGKTVLVRGIARGLGLPPETPVVSPTFTIARSYAVGLGGGAPRMLHHIDAYRLAGADDLENVGFEELCGEGTLTCVEWGGRVADALPADRLEITLDMDPAALTDTPAIEPGAIPVFPRQVRCRALGPDAAAILTRLAPHDRVGAAQ